MKRAADALFLLTSTSIKAGYIRKALAYSDVAAQLFPDDTRIVASRAYSLLLAGYYQQSELFLEESAASSRDIDLIRARNSILLNMSVEEQKERILRYLRWSVA